MKIVIDVNDVAWKIDQWHHYVVHRGPIPQYATIIRVTWDGMTATKEQYEAAFGE